jgi:glycosyltransferase involved in cell wall biosynthesis
VRALGRLPGVTVTGAVPDVRPFLGEARAAIAPLQMARGVQNKVLEAMAMARPVVASSPALEGLEATESHGALRADTPGEWISALEGLLAQPARAAVLGQEARDCVVRQYAWAACLRPLVDLCQRLLDERVAGESVAGVSPAANRTPLP